MNNGSYVMPECAVCGDLAPLDEEDHPVYRLLVEDLRFDAKHVEEVFFHVACFRDSTPWRSPVRAALTEH